MGSKNAIICHLHHALTGVTITGNRQDAECKVTSISFGIQGTPSPISDVPRDIATWVDMIDRFLDGSLKDLSSINLDLCNRTPFCLSVLEAARQIPWGATISYTELALRAGAPAAVRAVASVMRNNPFPLVVPCHRVVKKDGSIGGFMGEQRGAAIELKRQLLARELLIAP